MKAGNQKLGGDKKEDHGGDAEKLPQIDADTAFYKHHAKNHGKGYAQQCAQEAHEFRGVQRHTGKNGHGLNAFTENHQENKGKQPPLGSSACQGVHTRFNLALELTGGAHHKHDHADHHDGGHQHDPAFDAV